MTQDLENKTTKITDIEKGSPAEEAGLQQEILLCR